jgi:hypothetical protein
MWTLIANAWVGMDKISYSVKWVAFFVKNFFMKGTSPLKWFFRKLLCDIYYIGSYKMGENE